MSKKRSKPASPAATARGTVDVRHAGPDKISAALAAIGLVITGYLSVVALSGSTPALCSTGSSCDLIQQSHWSRLFGVPLALWGLLTYALALAVALMPATRLRRWRRLWTLAALGLGFSLYLTTIGIVELDAFCAWCLASLAVFIALFAWVTLKRPTSAPGAPWLNWSMGQAALLLGVIGISQAYYSGLFSPRPQPELQALARHLKQTGAQFYGASWCPTCGQQKALFGGAADELPYVECSPGGRGGPVAMACVNAGIENYPTWIIRGRRYTELMQVDELAQRSGFKWEPAKDAAAATPGS